MAIFTKEYDRKNVPLVVQLAQIDTDNAAEVHHAVALMPGNYRNIDPGFTCDPRAACDTAYSLLYALATNTGIPASAIDWVNAFHLPDYALQWDLKCKIPSFYEIREIEGLVTLDELTYESVDLEDPSFEAPVASDLHTVLYAAWTAKHDTPPIAGICSECENPFLHPTPRHVFCSRRCADRAGQKRRRKNKV